MTWLVTGGAGYIGAHVVRAFRDDGIDVVVIDDLSSGKAEFVPDGVPFVQANLLESGSDDPAEVERWRTDLQRFGVWANKPVPMFPYPGSPGYTRRWGAADDRAWERAMEHYLREYGEFSDIQDSRPWPLDALESAAVTPRAGR